MTDSEGNNRAGEAALWRRFRALERKSGLKVRDLGDPLTLAAYAEGRLGTKAAEAVESFLASKPEIIGDILAARAAVQASAPVASEAMIARAAGLVAPRAAPAFDRRVVPFRPTPVQTAGWRVTVSRFAIAASLVATGLVGFALGSDTYGNFVQSRAEASAPDLLDQPAGFLSGEDSSS
jgi:anti-sigma factor RsiW